MLRMGLVLVMILLIPIIVTILPSASAQKDTYYVYTDELPSWGGHAGNAVYEATNFWKENNDWLNFYEASGPSKANIHVQWVKDFGTETAGHAVDQWFVEVGLGDSRCKGKWQPYSENYVTYITAHEIGHVLGLGHTDDPDSIMYPIALNLEWGLVEEEFTLTENYGQFIPLCTIKDVTSINYWVGVDDPSYGFDVYFVPSVESFNDWVDGETFDHYSDEGCFEKGFISFGGTCNGVTKESGLLILMNSELTNPLTKLTVKMQEVQTQKTFSRPGIAQEEPSIFDDFYEDPAITDSDGDFYTDDEDLCPYSPETFNDFEDFDGCPDTVPPVKPDESEYSDLAYTSKNIYKTRIDELKSGIKTAEDSLSGIEFTNLNAKGKIGQAWTQHYNAQQHLEEIEKTYDVANYEISKKRFKSALSFYKGIDSESTRIGENLQWISALIADAKQLENESLGLTNIPDAFSEKETKSDVPDFIDPEKESQYYLDRYYNESDYKEWFDKNYPDYTIEQAIVIAIPDALSQKEEPKEEEKEKFCFLFWCW